MINFGIVQGRLLKPVHGNVQEFPFVEWEREFGLMESAGVTHMEWTINKNYYRSNPFFYCDLSGLRISSVCLDNIIKEDFNDFSSMLNEVVERCIEQGIERITLPFLDEANLLNDKRREHIKYVLNWFVDKDIKFSLETDCPISILKDIMTLEHLSITYDTGNINAACIDHMEFIETFHDRIDNVHLKDRTEDGISKRPPHGGTPFKEIFSKLKSKKYKGLYTLQTARSHEGFEHETIVSDKILFRRIYEKSV